jgi:hypothetical protein
LLKYSFTAQIEGRNVFVEFKKNVKKKPPLILDGKPNPKHPIALQVCFLSGNCMYYFYRFAEIILFNKQHLLALLKILI